VALARRARRKYRETVSPEERDEISASVAAHADLGPKYDKAVAEGLVDRIGEEIDKRVDARMRAMDRQPTPVVVEQHRGGGGGFGIVLVSLIFGTGATSVVVGNPGAGVAHVFMVALIWIAIAVINIGYARRKLFLVSPAREKKLLFSGLLRSLYRSACFFLDRM
jgi:hypothetical protein